MKLKYYYALCGLIVVNALTAVDLVIKSDTQNQITVDLVNTNFETDLFALQGFELADALNTPILTGKTLGYLTSGSSIGALALTDTVTIAHQSGQRATLIVQSPTSQATTILPAISLETIDETLNLISDDSVVSLASTLSGNGILRTQGEGTINLSSSLNDFHGQIYVDSGFFRSSGSQEFDGFLYVAPDATAEFHGPVSGPMIVVQPAATLRFMPSNDILISSALSGGGGLEIDSASSEVLLTGSNNLGQISVLSGILGLSPHSAQGFIGVSHGAVVRFYAGDTNPPGTYSSEGSIYFTGTLVGGGSVHKYGNDWLFLTENNNLPTGGISVYEGSLGLTEESLNTDISLASGTTLALDVQNDKTYTNVISGQGHIIKRGPAVLNLNTAQYGQFTLEEGTLLLNQASFSETATGPFINKGHLIVDIASSAIFDKNLTGDGSFEKQGLGTLRLSGDVSHNGPVLVTAGSLVLTENTLVGQITNNASLEFDIAAATTGEHHSQITGTGSLTKTGLGTLVLVHPQQSYSGGTTVAQGILETYSPVPNGDYAVSNGATLRYNMSAGDKTVTGTLSGNGTFEKIGPDLLILDSNNSFSGDFIIQEYEIRQVRANTLNSNVRVTLGNSAVFNLNDFDLEVGSLEGGGQVWLDSATLTTGANNNTTDFYGQISGSGGMNKDGSGTMRLHAQQTYTGNTHVLDGFLVQRTDNALSSQTRLLINLGAVFDVASYIGRANTVEGSGVLDIGSGTFNYEGLDTTTTTFSGDILGSSAANLNKNGSGVWVLSPATTLSYAGQTSINQGTLRYGIPNALNPNNKIFVAPGATWDLNNFSSTLKELTGSGTIALGSSGILTISSNEGPTIFDGAITGGSATNLYSFIKNGTATLTLTGTSSYVGQTQIAAGQISLGVDNALPVTTLLRLESGAIFETDDYQQSVAGIAGPGILSIGYITGSRNTFSLNGGTESTFDGVVRGNTNAVLNIDGSSSLILSALADPTAYLGVVNVSSGSTLELQHKFFGASAAFNTTGHIRSSGQIIIRSDKSENDSIAIPQNIAISGTGTVEFTGVGHTTITLPQLYSGATSISQGTVHYGVNQALASTTSVDIAAGAILDLNGYTGTFTALTGEGTLNFDSNSSLTLTNTALASFAGTIDGAANTSLTKVGSGEMLLAAGSLSQNLTNFQVSAGTLRVQGNLAHSLTLDGNSTYILEEHARHILSSPSYSPDNASLQSILLGTGSSMTWSGQVIIAGNATIGRSGALSTPIINITGGTLSLEELNASYTFNQEPIVGSPNLSITTGSYLGVHVAQGGTLTSDLVFTGSGALVKTGPGNLLLTQSQSYTGSTTINDGTLTLNDGVMLANASMLNDGSLVITGTTPTTNRTFNFPITGTGSLTINDATTGLAKLSFPNHWNYRGQTTISSGQVENTGQITLNNNSYIISPSASWRFLAPTLHLTGASSLQGLINIAGNTKIDTTGAGGSDLGNSSDIYQAQVAQGISWLATDNNPNTRILLESGSNLTLDATARSMEIAIDLSGSGSLTKTGNYRTVLKAPNLVNYTGATVVAAGTLVVDEKFSASSTPAVTVAQDATFAIRSLKTTTENRSYPNPSENPSIVQKLPFISYSILQYAGQEVPDPIPLAYSPTGGSNNYTQYNFPISGNGGVRIESPTIAKNAIYLSGELTYAGPTTVAADAFLYVDENFNATGDVYVDGVMQFYTPKRGEDDYHYVNNDFYSNPSAAGALIEKYGGGNLVLAGDFSGFYGLINIQEGRLFFTDLPPNVIDIIGISNLIARGGSILTITAAEAEVVFGGRIVGETNARYRLIADAGNAPLRVTSLDLDGRIDLRQRFETTSDPRITDPLNPDVTPPNGVAYNRILQPQFIIDNLIVAPRSQFYFQFDQAYTGAANLPADAESLRSIARLNFINDSIAQYILQGDRDSGLFENHRYRLLEFEDTPLNNSKVDQIMSLLRAPAMYVVEAQKVINVERSAIYLDVIITKRESTSVLTEIQSTLAPVTIGIAKQIQNRATSINNYERNANKVLENAADPDDLVKQVNYLIPNGNKKEKEQADPTATANTGSMAQQTVLNFQQNLLTKNFVKNDRSMSYAQKQFVSQAFKKRYDPIKDFNKRLSGHYESQNFSWADVFDGIDIFGLSTSVESSYTHVETKDLPNQPGQKVSTWSSTFGVSQVLQDKYIIGMMANYSARRIEFKPNTQNKTLLQYEKARNIGFFAAYQDMDVPYYWSTFLSFGNHDYDGTRTWFHPRYDESRTINEYIPTQATQQHEGYSITANVELGYTFTVSQEIALQPYIGAGINRLYEPAYREKSSPIGINEPDAFLYGNIMYPHLEKRHSRSIGLQAIQSFAIDNTAYQLSSRLSYVMTKNDGDERLFRYSYLYAPETINEIVTPNERYHAFELMLGFNIAYDYQWIISMNYSGNFGNKVTAHSIVGTIQYTFW